MAMLDTKQSIHADFFYFLYQLQVSSRFGLKPKLLLLIQRKNYSIPKFEHELLNPISSKITPKTYTNFLSIITSSITLTIKMKKIQLTSSPNCRIIPIPSIKIHDKITSIPSTAFNSTKKGPRTDLCSWR